VTFNDVAFHKSYDKGQESFFGSGCSSTATET